MRGLRSLGLLRAAPVLLGAALTHAACSDPARERSGAPPADEQVVARVGGDTINSDAVRAYVALHGGSTLDALRALEDDALLRQAARRAGWSVPSTRDTAHQEEQLLAQRVLLDLERAHPLTGPSDSEVSAYLERHQDSLVREETRDCVQVLVQLPEHPTDAQDRIARDYAAQVLSRMAREGVSEVWSAQPADHQGLHVLSQYLPPASPSTPMPTDLRQVVFELEAPGPTTTPVRTASGWHAIGVTAIHPPVEPGSPRALAQARQGLVTEGRRAALEALLSDLRSRFPVAVSARQTEVVLPLLGEAEGPGT